EQTPHSADERSLSGFVLLLGLPSRPLGLAHHTVVFSSDYNAEFEDLFRHRRFPSEPTVYISAPAAIDSSVAPPGGDAVFVMANAPPAGDHWTDEDTHRASRAVRAKLAEAGLDLGPIDVCATYDPARLADHYLAPGGAIYGTHSHGWKHAFFRPPNRSRHVPGLYFVGGSTHPGGGTPTVLMSAKITSELIQADASA